jgi:predicted GIY-YIG superfamily endonuclease
MVYLYELINNCGTIEYVGTTSRPKGRMWQHTKDPNKRGSSRGLFYGRNDLTMHIVDQFETRKQALFAETELKTTYGFKPTEWNNTVGKYRKWNIEKRKLTLNEVEEIKQLYLTGKYSHRKLGEMYNISHTAIGHMLRKQTYNCLEIEK